MITKSGSDEVATSSGRVAPVGRQWLKYFVRPSHDPVLTHQAHRPTITHVVHRELQRNTHPFTAPWNGQSELLRNEKVSMADYCDAFLDQGASCIAGSLPTVWLHRHSRHRGGADRPQRNSTEQLVGATLSTRARQDRLKTILRYVEEDVLREWGVPEEPRNRLTPSRAKGSFLITIHPA